MICLCVIYRDKDAVQSLDDGNWERRWDTWSEVVEPLYATKRVILDLGAGSERAMSGMFPVALEAQAPSDLLVSSMMLIEAEDLEDARNVMCLHPDIDHSNASNSATCLVIQPVHYLEMAQ